MENQTKSRDVFISYSSKDKTIADAICATLESHKIRCWIAPRDVQNEKAAGISYGASIINGIESSRMIVVVFNSNSNNSRHVMTEIERAFSKNLPIIPFRTEDIKPSQSLEYYLSSPHWLDAMTPPLEERVSELVQVVNRVLGRDAVEEATSRKRISSDETVSNGTTISKKLRSNSKATVSFSSSDLFEQPQGLIGQKIAGRYLLKKFIARGGGGAVFEAHDENLFRKICLKVAFPPKQHVHHLKSLVEKGVRGVVQMRHPGIVPILDFNEFATTDGKSSFFIAFELIDGEPMTDWTAQLGDTKQCFDRKLSVATKLAGIIHDAHQFHYIGYDGIEVVGVLHGDIKPNNVLVDQNDDPKLVDFMLVDIQQLQSDEVVEAIEHNDPITCAFGTPDFMAREQSEQGIITSKTDVFSLGCTLLQLLAPISNKGVSKFRDANKQVKALADSCMADDPNARPSALEVREALVVIHTNLKNDQSSNLIDDVQPAKEETVTNQKVSAFPPLRLSGKAWWLWGAVLATLLVVAAFVFSNLGKTTDSTMPTIGSSKRETLENNSTAANESVVLAVESSNSTADLFEAAAEGIRAEISIDLIDSGSPVVLNHFAKGELHACGTARPMKESEKQLCLDNGIEYEEVKISDQMYVYFIRLDDHPRNDTTRRALQNYMDKVEVLGRQ